jgi:hypothetical protein
MVLDLWGLGVKPGKGPLGMESNENRKKETIAEIKYLQKVRQSKSIFQRFNCHDAVAERKRKGQ